MSHFSVIVVTDQKPDEDVLRPILQPWHEYECTGVEDQYVVDVDVTAELESEWNKTTSAVRLADGTIKSRYHESLYTKKPDPKELFGRNQFELPAGALEIEIPQHELSAATGEAKADFAREYGGYVERDGKFWRRTNPNKKWDYWTIGGRYSGKFAVAYDPENDPHNKEPCWLCAGTGTRKDMTVANGCNGCQGSGISTKWPSKWKGVGNVIRAGEIPWDALRANAVSVALAEYAKAKALTTGMELPPFTFAELRDRVGIEAARDQYNAYPAVKALHEWWGADEITAKLKLSRDEIAQRAARKPLTCFAFVKDGKWIESGEMGWFGVSSNDKDPDQWQAEVSHMLESLPPDKWLAVVDCHI